jgi:hypothetical protein
MMDDDHSHLQSFRRLGVFREGIREDASVLISESIEADVVIRTVLVAATAVADDYLDSRFHLFTWLHDEIDGIERKYCPGGEAKT